MTATPHTCPLPNWWTRFRQRTRPGQIHVCLTCGIAYVLHKGVGWQPRTVLDRAKRRALAGQQPLNGLNAGLLNGWERIDLDAFARRWGPA